MVAHPRADRGTFQGKRIGRRLVLGFVVFVLMLGRFSSGSALAAQNDQLFGSKNLSVSVSFPDSGLVEDEQVCMGIFPAGTTDFSAPPLQSRCMDPGAESVLFEGLAAGDWVVAVPGFGTQMTPLRYQGQLVSTSIPEQDGMYDFGISVDLALLPSIAGTTGTVQVNVFGCPSGTDAGGDATAWQTACDAVASGVPISISGIGTGETTAMEGVTGIDGTTAGRLEFSGLPAGAYQLDGELPSNVLDPTIFIESSIEGETHVISAGDTLEVRPSETVAVNVYLVIDEGKNTPGTTPTLLIGSPESEITGGLTESEARSLEAQP